MKEYNGILQDLSSIISNLKAAFKNEYKYEELFKESANGINKIIIDWTAGDIEINEDSSCKDIVMVERASRELKDREKMKYKVEKDTLYIDFAHITIMNASKKIEVTIPEGLSKDIELVIKAVSSDLIINNCKFKNLKIDSISGDSIIKNMEAKDINVVSKSGDIKILGKYDTGFINSISGDIMIANEKEFELLKIRSISGNINIHISDNIKIPVSYKVISGKFKNYADINVVKTKEAKLIINSTSGNISLR